MTQNKGPPDAKKPTRLTEDVKLQPTLIAQRSKTTG